MSANCPLIHMNIKQEHSETHDTQDKDLFPNECCEVKIEECEFDNNTALDPVENYGANEFADANQESPRIKVIKVEPNLPTKSSTESNTIVVIGLDFKKQAVIPYQKPHSNVIAKRESAIDGNAHTIDSNQQTNQHSLNCTECEYIAPRKISLQKHIAAVHQGAKPFACQDCDYKASQKGHLQHHIAVIHKGLKPYACTECDYKSARKDILLGHIDRVHRNIKPPPAVKRVLKTHSCPECEYTSTHKPAVNRHVNDVHRNLKPHECPDCDFKTSRKALLQSHFEKVHKGPKMHSCSACGYESAAKKMVKKHIIKDHTGLKPRARVITTTTHASSDDNDHTSDSRHAAIPGTGHDTDSTNASGNELIQVKDEQVTISLVDCAGSSTEDQSPAENRQLKAPSTSDKRKRTRIASENEPSSTSTYIMQFLSPQKQDSS